MIILDFTGVNGMKGESMEMPPTRPQPVYEGFGPPLSLQQSPLTAPRFVPNPVPGPPPVPQPPGPGPSAPQPPVPPTQHRPPRQWTMRQRAALGVGIGAVILIASAIGNAASSGSGQPAYVTQLQSDGYTLEDQGTLTGGEGVGYADGDNEVGAGELVVQTLSDADAQATANGMQGNSDVDVTTQGDLPILQSSSYSTIRELVTSEGW
jgi:hypothetical protein